jgi:hypothetical protein
MIVAATSAWGQAPRAEQGCGAGSAKIVGLDAKSSVGASRARLPPGDDSMADPFIPRPDAQTVAAYETTNYFAHEVKPVLLRIGDPPAAHRAWLENKGAQSATILTAWNPLGEELPAQANDRAQAALLAEIQAGEYRWLPASGQDPAGTWQPEPGFCVFDVPDDVLDRWLVQFRQNAAVQTTRQDPCRLVWHPSIRRMET